MEKFIWTQKLNQKIFWIEVITRVVTQLLAPLFRWLVAGMRTQPTFRVREWIPLFAIGFGISKVGVYLNKQVDLQTLTQIKSAARERHTVNCNNKSITPGLETKSRQLSSTLFCTRNHFWQRRPNTFSLAQNLIFPGCKSSIFVKLKLDLLLLLIVQKYTVRRPAFSVNFSLFVYGVTKCVKI